MTSVSKHNSSTLIMQARVEVRKGRENWLGRRRKSERVEADWATVQWGCTRRTCTHLPFSVFHVWSPAVANFPETSDTRMQKTASNLSEWQVLLAGELVPIGHWNGTKILARSCGWRVSRLLELLRYSKVPPVTVERNILPGNSSKPTLNASSINCYDGQLFFNIV